MELFIPLNFWLLFAAAMLISAIGFYKYVYFISLGYGFSIAGLGALMLFLFRENLSIGTVIACALFIVYGIRLGGYLLVRELKSAAYRGAMKKEIKDGSTMKFGVKCAIWITCGALYVTQVLPVFYRLHNTVEVKNFLDIDGFTIAGTAIMAFGLIFESIADIQKNNSKKKNPNRFCDTGLYRIVRCPNYLGEMIFWTGVLVSGANILTGVGQWVLALIGYIGIIFVMFSGARRLELRQNRNYGDDPEYQAYVKKVPIMVPFIPLYSVAKYKFLVA